MSTHVLSVKGSTLKGKNLLPRGTNSFSFEQSFSKAHQNTMYVSGYMEIFILGREVRKLFLFCKKF